MRKKAFPEKGLCSPEKEEDQNIDLPLKRVMPESNPQEGPESASKPPQNDERDHDENAAQKIWFEAGHF